MVEKGNVRLRFHLARGEHYMHWQLRRGESRPTYWSPSANFKLKDVTLYNRRNVAEKIYNGENKTVCAWLSISGSIKISTVPTDTDGLHQISYNPRVSPFWTYKDIVNEKSELINLDMQKFDEAIINGKEIFVI